MSLLARLRLFAFLGSLLLFGLEPLVGRLLLPSCGGGFHVWAACLMFFQGALFLGYLYCHFFAARLGRWHLLLALIPLAFLPVGRWLGALEPNPAAPTGSILGALSLSIAVPFVVLSTTGVIAQHWLADSDLPERENPYQLYAASNAGSFAALLAYPLLVEPLLGLTAQRWGWSLAFFGYWLLAWSVAPKAKEQADPAASAAAEPAAEEPAAEEPAAEEPAEAPITIGRLLVWLVLSAAPSAVLMAVTNVIAMDLGSVPLVWVVPLSIYLLSFVLTFGPQERYPKVLAATWPLAFAMALVAWVSGSAFSWLSGLVQLLVLGVACWVGHAELYRSRPAPRALTAFYLCVSLGGWLGGVFVALIAPRAFDSLLEYPLALAALALALIAVGRERTPSQGTRAIAILSLAALVGAGAWVIYRSIVVHPWTAEVRNEYGIYRIGTDSARRGDGTVWKDKSGNTVPLRSIIHGTTIHGRETIDPRGHGRPIGYFHSRSPLGQTLRFAPPQAEVAIVGLGAGALAGNLRSGDRLTYYELDPLVEKLAREYFHYLEKTQGTIEGVKHGDARLELNKVSDASYDVLIIDAFSSDAIPVHLLTREALELYLRKLKPTGWLVFHISSRYYDLKPVLRATAAALDPKLLGLIADTTKEQLAPLEDPSQVYLLTRQTGGLEALTERGWKRASELKIREVSPWSDDYANILVPLWAKLTR